MALGKLKSETRREQIVEAALGLIATQGLARLSMASVARRVGLVPSALYRHFGSKQDILQAAVQRVGQKAGESLREVRDLTPNALKRLDLLFGGIIKMDRELQAMPRIVSSEGMSDNPAAKRQVYGVLKGVLSGIEAITREGQERGEVRKDFDAKSLAVMFWGMIPAAVILWDISDGRFDVTRQAEDSWQLFSKSIQPNRFPVGMEENDATFRPLVHRMSRRLQ
jgi:TetR/AcrR family transcriptional regulator, fatty acid metabolism regulator protein